MNIPRGGVALTKDSGFSLIEVLISVVVLSIGLLGLAGLQTTSMRFSQDSYVRSLAVAQAYGMADRMRANQAGTEAGNYNNVSGIPGTVPSCTSCTPAEVATKDLATWNTANAALLPSGQGSVLVSGSFFNIVVRWDAERTGATGTGCGGDPNVDLTCLIISVQP